MSDLVSHTKIFRIIERVFVTSTVLTFTIYLLWPLTYRKENYLPVKRWHPYSINSKTTFWMTYMYDCITGYLFAFFYSSLESLFTTFMQQVSTQLDIFINCLSKISKITKISDEKLNTYEQECTLIRECVNRHICIFL